MQRQRQHNLKDPREDVHPFGVQVVSKMTGEGKLGSADTISGLDRTNSHPGKSDIGNKWTAMWRSHGRDVFIVIVLIVSLTAIYLATWNKVQTDVEVQKLKSENGDLKKAIQNLFLRAEKTENGSVTQKLNDDGGNVTVYNKTLLETLTTEIHSLKAKVEDAASTLADLAQKDAELENADSMLLKDVNTVTQKLLDRNLDRSIRQHYSYLMKQHSKYESHLLKG